VEWEEKGARYGIRKSQIDICKKRSVIALIRTSKAGATAIIDAKLNWNMMGVTLENEERLRMRINRKYHDKNLRKSFLEKGKIELEEFQQANFIENCLVNKDRASSYDQLRTHFIKL